MQKEYQEYQQKGPKQINWQHTVVRNHTVCRQSIHVQTPTKYMYSGKSNKIADTELILTHKDTCSHM